MNSVIVKLIFSLCAQYAGGISQAHDSKLLTCYDKLVNCSNVQSTSAVHKCYNQMQDDEPTLAFLARVRKGQ
jgi:hypothetical protein